MSMVCLQVSLLFTELYGIRVATRFARKNDSTTKLKTFYFNSPVFIFATKTFRPARHVKIKRGFVTRHG